MPDRVALKQHNEDLQQRLKERTRALGEVEALYGAIFNSSFTLAGLSTVDGVVLEVNRSALEAVGARIEEVVGKHLWESPWFAQTPQEASKVEEVFRTRPGTFVRYEATVQFPDGKWRTFDFSMRPVVAAGSGEVRFMVVEGRDQTELRQAQQRLQHSERMEALGLLTGGVAHDFNNILTVIIGALDLVVRRPEKANCETLISAALEAAYKAEALNKQLLAFGRRTPVAPRTLSVAAALRELEPLLRKAIGESVELSLDLGLEHDCVHIDPSPLEAAILNLAVNARDAMPSGGQLMIETRRATVDEVRGNDIEGGALALSVSDTGHGIPSSILPRIFDPFFTTKDASRGTGLGLSQVYGFAKQSGGAVTVDSSPAGSRFKLLLPLVGCEEPLAPPREVPPADVACRVLLVEDEAAVAAVTRAMLLDLGADPVVARDGGEAKQLLASGAFDVMITDVVMPGGLNGVQLAEWAALEHPSVKVVLCSGWTGDALAHDMLGRQWPLLQKPFETAKLRKALLAS